MQYILVDTENVGSRYLQVINSIKKGDKLILFYTDNNGAMSIPVAVLNSLTAKGAFMEAILCRQGHNALDFQLVSYLGYLISQSNPNDNFIVYTKDHGFNVVVSFWKERGIHIKRSSPNMKIKKEDIVFNEVKESVIEKNLDNVKKENTKKDFKQKLSIDVKKEFYLL